MSDAGRAGRRWVATAGVLLLMIAAISPALPAAAWQETEAPATEVAAPPVLEQAWRFLGWSEATTDRVTLAGWLTGVSGLTAAELAPSEAAPDQPSRFTFVADIPVARTSSRGPVVTNLGDGTLTIYLQEETTPSEDDLSSFGAGTVVAVYDAELQETAQRQTPALGIVSGQMTLEQTDALNFSLDGQRFRFGHADAGLAVRYTGGLAPDDGAGLSEATIFGTASVASRAADPQGTGEAAPAVALSECEQFVLWVEASRSRLQTASEVRTAILSAGDPTAADLEAALATLAALVDEQRADIGPEASAEAARLALAALSTDARGIELLLTATTAGNGQGVSQGLAILSDAEGLAGRALATLDAITPTCEPSS